MEIYRHEFDLVFNQAFGKFPDSSLKHYSRFQCGLIIYHSLSYSRQQKSRNYNVCVKYEGNSSKSGLRYGQIIFFFCMHNQPFFLLKRYLNSKNTFSSLLDPIEEIPGWDVFIERYYQIVQHSKFELVIVPCSCILFKCIFVQLDKNFTVCTQIELETEHD